MPDRRRLAIALGCGLFLALLSLGVTRPVGYEAGDLSTVWHSAQALLAGTAPYPPAGTDPVLRVYYPLPAMLLLVPLAGLSVRAVTALWIGTGMALLAWFALGRFGIHGAAVMLSRMAERATAHVQWTSLYFAGAFVPAFQVLDVCKPTIALLVFAYRPTRWALAGLVLVALSFAVRPTWFGEWLVQTRGAPYYVPAALVVKGGGPLLFLAALRWRRPEARLLFAMACVPQNYLFYDQLLLFLVPKTTREVWTLSGLSWVAAGIGAVLMYRTGLPDSAAAAQATLRAPIVALCYLPCAIMVLRRPNEGRLATWIGTRLALSPRWLGGRAAS
jgi:hypothetical protein